MNKTTKIYFASLFIGVTFLCSCKEEKEEPVKYQNKQTIVNAKAKIRKSGDDVFMFSYTNGQSEQVDFGLYNKYKVGDTVCWEMDMEESWSGWYIVECK